MEWEGKVEWGVWAERERMEREAEAREERIFCSA